MPGDKHRVLFVDDDPLALVLVKRIFETEPDIELVTTTSPNEAMNLMLVSPADLVVSDQRMPEMLGLQLLARMRELAPGALRILLTAYPDLEIAMEGINKGLLHRLALKPWDPDDMVRTVRGDLVAKRTADRNRMVADQLRGWFSGVLESERAAVATAVRNSCLGSLETIQRVCQEIEDERRKLVEVAGKTDDVEQVVLAARKIAGHARTLATMTGRGGELAFIAARADEAAAHEPWNLGDIVLTAVHLAFGPQGDKQPRLELGRTPGLLTPGEDVAAIVLHLLANARDATPETLRRDIRVRTWHEKREIFIEVRTPNGPLPEEVKQNLFKPQKTARPNRLGLGLATCAVRAGKLGGRLLLSHDDRDGVAFQLVMPARPTSSQRPIDTIS